MKHAMSSITVAVVLMSIYGAGYATSASAGESVAVHYHTADLSLSQGPARLLSRIHDAAVEACGGEVEIAQLERRKIFVACVRHSMDQAVADLGSPLVAGIYNQRTVVAGGK